MKYIQHDKLGFILWRAKSGMFSHKEMADLILAAKPGKLLSAGFVLSLDDGQLKCFGDSLTLNLSSHENDTALLKTQLEEI
jgi:hypothetical protein